MNSAESKIVIPHIDKSLLKEITIIITVRGRCKHLRRALDYYSRFPVKVLVMDSSDKPCRFKRKPENFALIYCPQTRFQEVLITALESVNTKYSIIANDDDFIIPSAMAECVSFLNENNDYQCAYGHIGRFLNKGQRPVELVECYLQTPFSGVTSDTPQERVFEHLGHFLTNFFAVHRTQYQLTAFKEGRHMRNQSSHDVVTGTIMTMYGKSKVLPILYYVREYIFTAQSSLLGKIGSHPKFIQIVQNPDQHRSVLQESEQLLTLAFKKIGINKTIATKSIKKSFQAFNHFNQNYEQIQSRNLKKLQQNNIKTFEIILSEDTSRQNWALIQAIIERFNLSHAVPPLLVDDDGRTIKHWYNISIIFFLRIKAAPYYGKAVKLAKRIYKKII